MFVQKEDIIDRYRSPPRSLLWLYTALSDEIQPAGHCDLIKEQSSEVGFNEALKRAPTTHAHPLSSISGASGGICKPFW